MTRKRRQALLRVAERIAVGLVALDAIVFFAAYRLAHQRLNRAQDAYSATRLAIVRDQSRLEQLEKVKAGLPAASTEFKDFLDQHIPRRRRGFSDAALLVQKLTTDAGVGMGDISYKLSKKSKEPFDRLAIQLTVEGTFPQILKFVHSIETEDKFVVVRNFTLDTGDNGQLSLRLAADLFLTP